MKTLLSAAALVAAIILPQDVAAPTGPTVGKPAPELRLNDHTGKAVKLAGDKRDSWTVLAFFPKAATPG